jgi:hypothetical protein
VDQEENYFNEVSRDSMSWLENSEKLKVSADIINNELQVLLAPFFYGNFDYQHEDKIVALWNSYFLLIGHAFENLIKGLSIENNRAFSSYGEIFDTLWKKYSLGHGVSRIAKDNLFDLTDTEFKILEKLEIFVIWAGRYPLPKKFEKYLSDKSRLFYDTNDYQIMNALFDRIKRQLLEHWERNEAKALT